MHNVLTSLLGIQVPVIGAPMAGASEADLCTAVARAGGLGLIGAGKMDLTTLSRIYTASRDQLHNSDAAHSAIGIGLFNYCCSKASDTLQNIGRANLTGRTEGPSMLQDLLQTSIDLKPRAIWLSFGDWKPLALPIKEAGITLICQVQHLEQVEPALLAGADIIVGQSQESGGHGASPASLVSFIPELVDCVNALCQKLNIQQAVPVAAAGGICDARQMAAAFALGASGVVLGTILNATHESVYPEAKKQALVKAGSSSSCNPSTIRTTLYDELSDLPWPATIDGQCLRNGFTAEYSSQTPLQDAVKQKVKEEHNQATADNTLDKLVVWSGTSIGLVNSIQHAEDVVNNLMRDVKIIFLNNAQLVGKPRVLGQGS